MNSYEIFFENIEKEMRDFKHSYLDMQPCQVYNDWYIIGFYESYYDMFTSDYINYQDYEEVYEWLGTLKNPLCFLYDEWLNMDGSFDQCWDAMWDVIITIYDKYNGGK